ncbi:MAG: NAD(P)/FAD-dependent oxidoreductase [Thermoanaerobacteraceae bacterium]|nr:NAD(P)/FAD-dependent oxidoreductase [Thermoanaerobacteraceae bacterium]
MMDYDVIIVGAGPAGIFASYELMQNRPGLKVLLLEKGRSIEGRNCPIGRGTSCSDCSPCSITSGFGGAGAFSDGKLTLTSEFGGVLDEYIGKNEVVNLIRYIDEVYVRFGGTTEVHGRDEEKVKELSKKAAAADLKFIPAEIKHLGTEKCYEILKNMQSYLKERVDLKTSCSVKDILVNEGKVTGVSTDQGDFYGKFVMVAPGRNGAGWFREQCEKLELNTRNNAVDIGVRVEVPAEILEDITDAVYESKLVYYTKSFDDRVRTFCMNPYGEVVEENVDGLKTVNGHSYKDKRTANTNFALLVSKEFTEPFHEPIDYGKYIARLANMLGEGVIVQRLGDLLDGRRSTPERIKRGLLEPTLKAAVPGDLSLVLPYRHLTDIIEMLQAMDKIAPGIYSKHTLLYGVEVKFYSSRVNLTEGLETEIENLYAAGDGAGVSRGLAQASASGVLVARQILGKVGN